MPVAHSGTTDSEKITSVASPIASMAAGAHPQPRLHDHTGSAPITSKASSTAGSTFNTAISLEALVHHDASPRAAPGTDSPVNQRRAVNQRRLSATIPLPEPSPSAVLGPAGSGLGDVADD